MSVIVPKKEMWKMYIELRIHTLAYDFISYMHNSLITSVMCNLIQSLYKAFRYIGECWSEGHPWLRVTLYIYTRTHVSILHWKLTLVQFLTLM